MRRLGRPLPTSGLAPAPAGLAWRRSTIVATLLLAALLGVALGAWLHHARAPTAVGSAAPPAPLRLPLLNGVQGWAPGQRGAPNSLLRDVRGGTVSLAVHGGRTVLIAFLDSRGGDVSAREARSLAAAVALVAGAPAPLLDIVSLQPGSDSAARVQAATRRWGLPAGGYHWLVGPRPALAGLRGAFGLDASPAVRAGLARAAVYLVDRNGWQRAGYLFPFPPTVLARDVRTLERSG